VDHIKVVLDKRIPINLIQDVNGQNVIFCKSFRDELFETGNFSTKDKDFVHKYVTENNKKYIITDVTTSDGQTYKNVKFQVILNEKGETPFSTFNPKGETSVADSFKLPEKKQLIVETNKAQVKPAKRLDVSESINKRKQDQEYILKAKQLEQSLIEEKARLVKERKELEEQKQIVKNERIIEEKINDYKQSLLQEFLNVSEKQEITIKEKLSINLKNFENELDEQKQLHNKDIKIVLEDLNRNSVEKLKSFLEKRIDEQKNELISLLENKGDDFVSKIVDKSDELKKLFDEKFVVDLQQYKEKLIQELNSINENLVKEYLEKKKTDVGDYINTFISKERSTLKKDFSKNIEDLKNLLEKTVSEFNERTPSLDEKIKLVQEKLDQLPKEGQMLIEAKDDIISLSKKYTDSQLKRVSEDTKSYAKRILDLGGGGGSVATQYANGGTMNGDLNVNGHILSGGVDLLNIFSGGGLTDRLVNGSYQAVLSSDGNLTVPGAIVTASNSKLDLVGFGPNTAYLTTTPDDTTALFMGTFGAELRANTYASIATNTGGTPYLWEFGTDGSLKFPDNTSQTTAFTGNPDSSKWDSTFTTVKNTSANWSQAYTNLIYNSAAYLSGFNSTAITQNSANWNTAYTNLVYNSTAYLSAYNMSLVNANSANWNNTYTQYSQNSAKYARTDQNVTFENDVTILGNLTAKGTATFANTIFTTTSALSVINTGPGPALYVFQASGPSDVASFYDGDGVEVLHVGNAQGGGNPLGQVGINTSFPSAELTVNGAISSNGDVSVVNMQAFNAVGIGTYAPIYFNLDVSGPAGNGSIGSSHGDLSFGSTSNILINPNNNLLLGPVGNVGIGTTTPSVKLTVNGAISSNETITALGGNSNQWNTAYTNLIYNSASYLTGASLNYVNTNFVKISGDTMTGTLSVGSGGNLFSPSFATFVKNSSYVSLSSTLTDNSLYFNSKATFASPGGFIIKGHSPDYSTSIQNLPGKGTYGMWLQNVDNMDPGTTFVSDGRAQVTHAMSFRAGIDNFTAGSDHNHVQWQGAPSNNTQAWQMTNGGSTSVYGYGSNTYSQRFLVHTLPQYQISTTIAATSGYFDTRNANLVTNTDKVSGVVILLDTTFGAGNYNLITPGSVVGVTLNPGLVGLAAVIYNSQCTQVSSNGGSLSAFQFDFFIGSGSNWVPAQKGIQAVNLQSRTNGGNPGVSLITSQVGSNPSTQYVGITGCYRNMTKHALARFSTSSILSGFKPGSPLTLWIPTAMPSTSPIGTGFITSDKISTFAQGTFPTGVRTGYFDAYVINVSGTDMEFALCNLMDSYGFENRFWPISADGNAGWLLYGGTQDTVHRPTFGTTGFYFEREPWYFADPFNYLSGGMVKCVGLGNSEVYGDFSYGLGYRGAVLGKKSGTFAGDYNAVYSDNSVALGGEGLISLSSTPYQAVIGKYNNPNNNALFVVGAGGGDTNRVNVLEVNNNSLTVTGSLSASGTMFASGGNSNQWSTAYTNLVSNSTAYLSAYNMSLVNANSANWNTAYTNLVNNSANYLSGASISYVNTNFVKLSGDTMTGSLNIIGNLSASAIGYFNHVAAATKSFYIPHPTKSDMHLQYGSLESPYHGIRLTGNGSVKCGDSVVVPLPDYIFSLVHQEGVNIQLTNYQHNKTLFVDNIDVNNNTFTVKCEKKLFDKGEYKFFWSFTAIRKDIPLLQVEC
jgi:hypothetical protein